MINDDLKKIGLTENESKVYLALLELSESTIARISEKSKVKRTTVYLSINSLKEKGLASSIKRKNKTLFFAEDPRKIQEKEEERRETIKKIMPELLSFSNLIDKKPKIRFFEGKEGIKEVFKETLKYPKTELAGWFPDQVYWLGKDFFTEVYMPARVKNKIWIKALAPKTKFNIELSKEDAKYLKETRFVDDEGFNVKVEIILYGANKINIISYTEEIGLIIESKNIFDSLKSIFDVMWRSSSER
ncbi:TPA: hypothetical protein DCZ46_01010 [Candidatus Campbellbacteria bacterium]|nr:MAG: transcriptional regulator TrmB [Candidatus Campbellbacteria bacterium GW2011_OD1_34_28]KKP75333.1 MAG: Transcriptional regulator, TrmB [Candidatus Campbellbacteria bacterium GW2011_GWD2_35_24]KKP76106.1 MAG: transcriptional regulator TrmB [Candidatus Campbellbacteria bacterium GW2011_GWC2_35_28]KKP77295.1 MAG: Transcriptional regulator, TrmB [Candidatus Campbellbacteria bacterium GW2011_GWC1_35_31]KKP79224.1 MAG: Transcriptional regulator, TrmB [Candidatus Campbellbacteria bacterium GW2